MISFWYHWRKWHTHSSGLYPHKCFLALWGNWQTRLKGDDIMDPKEIFTQFMNQYDLWPHPIPGFSNYKIDRCGNVFDNLGNILKPYHYNDGEHYDSIYLRDDNGNAKVIAIHQLVAMTFDPNYTKECVVHHMNENKYYNCSWNLECMTREEHAKHHAPQKYFDKWEICDVCGQPFIWKADVQERFYSDLKRGKNRIKSCSKSCSGYYARQVQLGNI